MKEVRIGILGCANVVKKHVAKAIGEIDNGRLTVIASRDVCKAREFARELDCEFVKSYNDLIARDNIDAVYIALPIGLHEKWAIEAAKNKKNVLCEKSLSDSFSSVIRIVKECEKNKVILYENFMCNYHRQHNEVASLISRGEIGDVFLFNGCFGFPPLDKENIRYDKLLGGGALNDAGSYPVFMARKILKAEPVYVTANLFYSPSHDVDIRGSAYLEFPDGKVAIAGFGFDNMYQNNYSIWGSKGVIRVDRAYSIPADMRPRVELVKQDIVAQMDIVSADQFKLIFSDFCSKIINRQTCDYDGLIAQARTMEAIRMAAKSNKKIDIGSIN